ncbi:hypothetical protein AAFN88_12850 [Pelagibius sp. CAU 1746]|uniref:hypothetical protein n=1 Tax=Pelagibius sp. CAU 1746 TaxID=3140370 RepID=UPI00325B4F1D
MIVFLFNLCSFGRELAEEEAAQEALGLTPDQQNALTKDERTRFIAGLRQMTPEQRAAALKELQAAYGDQAGAVMADLVEAGLPLNDSLTGDSGGGPEVSGRLAQAGESQGEAKTPEGDVIEEATEGVIGEGQEAAGHSAEIEDREGADKGAPPLPLRKPVPKRVFDEQEVLRRHRDLFVSDIDTQALDQSPDDLLLRRLIAQLGQAAEEAGVSEDMRHLAIKLGVKKLIVEGNGPRRAHRLAADEAGIEWLVPSRGYSFDNSAFRPREQEYAVVEVQAFFDAFDMDYEIEDEAAAALLLPALREFWGTREAARLYGAAEFERRIENLVAAGIQAGIDIKRGDVRDLAWTAIDDPLRLPWAQTKSELKVSLGKLAEQVEAAGDIGLIQSLGETLLDLAPAGGTLAKGAKKAGTVAFDLWGIGSALTTEEASDLLAKSVKELLRRDYLIQ